MEDTVGDSEKTERYLELEDLQRGVQKQRLQRYLGRTVSVLAEKVSSKSDLDLTGHSTCHKVVNFRGTPDLLGGIHNVRITEVKSNSLFGEVC
jgi:tRNA-2-methylthio-N6-dimethylallyladenosine synthase